MSDSTNSNEGRDVAGAHQSVTSVSLVIPGRNCAGTIEKCLRSVVPLLESGELREIIFVNDGSTDDSEEIVAGFPGRIITGRGIGAAAARNDGIEQTTSEFIWCIDADCIAQNDTLSLLLKGFESDAVAAVGGSLGNACPDSLLATLVQDEITWRHTRMPEVVNFLASGNVVYRRSAIQQVGGFDESFRWAHDAELAYRFRSTNRELRFRKNAVVLHHHFTKWHAYLFKQAAYAKNRMLLYQRYPQNVRGDDYSSLIDHMQPPLALGLLLTLPLVMFPSLAAIPLVVFVLLVTCAAITTVSVYKGRPKLRMIPFLLFSVIRSTARAAGACHGIVAVIAMLLRSSEASPTQQDLVQ